ncbi:MAG: vacuolar ATPase assembly integral membrane protein vma21 [Vezdaea aestivalis]|nr:MAG: vacuolar ATPase assembly integral membrane protein vma21 [Vezdaea aestivalis]
MATRRTGASVIPAGVSAANTPSEKSDVTPAVPAAVIYKLLIFTAAMVTAPIGTYFLTVNAVFGGNATFAGGSAALVANIVLISYVVVAMKEDQSEKIEEEERRKKGL